MYVCLNTFVYVYACTWVGGLVVVRFRVSVRVSMKPVMFIPIYPDVYTHYIYICIYMYIYVFSDVCIQVYHMYMYINLYIYIYDMYIYIHICIYICI